tara:strand:- start:309 stop:1568 length:1260 start_codon:yes stop_codon:yes gene_type:complete
MSTGLQKIYDELGIKELLDAIKNFSQNINDYMPLSKMFFIIIYIFNFDFKFEEKEKVNKYIMYIVKFLICAIIIVMPIILLITTLIQLNNIIKKNKKYWWAEEKYNYLNTKYIYIKKIYDIFGITLSHNIVIYLSCTIAFIIMTSILFIKFKKLIENTENHEFTIPFKKLLYYNGSIFIIIFLIITTFLGINYNKYNRVFGYNREINNIYLRYLNKDYIKTICNNFIDNDNNITDICTFKKVPDSNDLNTYLLSLDISKLQMSDMDLDNEKLDINYNTQIANKFLSALITHQFLLFIYNNQYNDISNDNKFCRELKLNTILNNKMDNIFYCYKETLQFPFKHNVEGELINIKAKSYFNANYEVYTLIIDKYLEINNKLAKNITNIKKENIDEITIVILIAILFIIYLIGLFFVFGSNES